MEWFNKWIDTLYNTFIVGDRYMTLVEGFEKTLIITFGALLIGVIIGTIVAITKVFAAHNKKLKLFDVLCNIYLTVIRGTPVVVQLLISFFIIFVSAKDGTWVAMITFGVNSGAYVAETIRSGILAIDNGQMEAGRSLGLNYRTTMMKIVIPQAIKNILPALGNEMITLFKDTSLVSVIALRDLTKTALSIQGVTYQAFMPLVGVALIYLICVIIMTKLLAVLEGRLRASDRR